MKFLVNLFFLSHLFLFFAINVLAFDSFSNFLSPKSKLISGPIINVSNNCFSFKYGRQFIRVNCDRVKLFIVDSFDDILLPRAASCSCLRSGLHVNIILKNGKPSKVFILKNDLED